MVTALKATASPLSLLCMEVHHELAQCEDLSKSVVTSRDELKAALHCDYGGLDKDSNAVVAATTVIIGNNNSNSNSSNEDKDIGLDRNRFLDHIIQPYLDLQEIRCLIYDTPSEVEGQALQWIQLAQESNFKPYIQDMITKSLYLLLDQIDREASPIVRQGAQRNAVGGIDYLGYLAGYISIFIYLSIYFFLTYQFFLCFQIIIITIIIITIIHHHFHHHSSSSLLSSSTSLSSSLLSSSLIIVSFT